MIPAVGEDGLMNLVLSQPQLRVIKHAVSPKTTCIAVGSIRAGKNFSVTISAAIWCASQETDCDVACIGVSIESCWRNQIRDIVDFLNSVDGLACDLDRSLGFRLIIRGISTVNLWLFSAVDAKARKRIQGATLRGLIIDEAAILEKSFIYQALGRLSDPLAKCWMTCNPDGGPQHWFKKELIDAANSDDTEIVSFCMDDNPSLKPAVKDRLKASFAQNSVYYRRFVLGEWVQAEGVIYPDYEVTEQNEIEGGRWWLSLDWGVSTTLAVIAVHARGPNAIISHEFCHNAKRDGIINEQQAVNAIVEWFEKIGKVENTVLLCDPHTCSSTKILLREAKFNVRNAINNLLPGIICTQRRFANGEVRINARCENVLREIANYCWDTKASERGITRPYPKQDDHYMDCCRYYTATTNQRLARPLTVKDIGL